MKIVHIFCNLKGPEEWDHSVCTELCLCGHTHRAVMSVSCETLVMNHLFLFNFLKRDPLCHSWCIDFEPNLIQMLGIRKNVYSSSLIEWFSKKFWLSLVMSFQDTLYLFLIDIHLAVATSFTDWNFVIKSQCIQCSLKYILGNCINTALFC